MKVKCLSLFLMLLTSTAFAQTNRLDLEVEGKVSLLNNLIQGRQHVAMDQPDKVRVSAMLDQVIQLIESRKIDITIVSDDFSLSQRKTSFTAVDRLDFRTQCNRLAMSMNMTNHRHLMFSVGNLPIQSFWNVQFTGSKICDQVLSSIQFVDDSILYAREPIQLSVKFDNGRVNKLNGMNKANILSQCSLLTSPMSYLINGVKASLNGQQEVMVSNERNLYPARICERVMDHLDNLF